MLQKIKDVAITTIKKIGRAIWISLLFAIMLLYFLSAAAILLTALIILLATLLYIVLRIKNWVCEFYALGEYQICILIITTLGTALVSMYKYMKDRKETAKLMVATLTKAYKNSDRNTLAEIASEICQYGPKYELFTLEITSGTINVKRYDELKKTLADDIRTKTSISYMIGAIVSYICFEKVGETIAKRIRETFKK